MGRLRPGVPVAGLGHAQHGGKERVPQQMGPIPVPRPHVPQAELLDGGKGGLDFLLRQTLNRGAVQHLPADQGDGVPVFDVKAPLHVFGQKLMQQVPGRLPVQQPLAVHILHLLHAGPHELVELLNGLAPDLKIDALLSLEVGLEGGQAGARLPHNFPGGGFLVALFRKQLLRRGQNTVPGRVISTGHSLPLHHTDLLCFILPSSGYFVNKIVGFYKKTGASGKEAVDN